jgi:hypoxanthine phosphoribosyltransferase
VKIGAVCLEQPELEQGVARLAAALDRDLAGRTAILVGILKGSVFFLCDLAKRMGSPVEIDFLQVSSYGTGTRSSGNVQLLRDLSLDVAGRDVVIVEDIVDTGRTLKKIVEILATRKPRSIKICALLRKRIEGNDAVPVDYLGFEIGDRFVVGYGLDFAERYRNLPYVAFLEEDKETT